METNEMYLNNGKEKKREECNRIKLSCLDVLKSNSRDTKFVIILFIYKLLMRWVIISKLKSDVNDEPK